MGVNMTWRVMKSREFRKLFNIDFFSFIVCNHKFVKGTGEEEETKTISIKTLIFLCFFGEEDFSVRCVTEPRIYHETAENNFIFFVFVKMELFRLFLIHNYDSSSSWAELGDSKRKKLKYFSTVWLCVFNFSFSSRFFSDGNSREIN